MGKTEWRHRRREAARMHQSARRIDCKLSVEEAIALMRDRGQLLLKQFHNGRPSWSLSGGGPVAADVAAVLTSNSSVHANNDALFAGTGMSQTWRWSG